MPFISQFDILFWLLIALVAAVAFTIEAGLEARHRRAMLTTLFSATLSVLFMMFLVEDRSNFDFGPPPAKKKNKGGPAEGADTGGDQEGGAGSKGAGGVAAKAKERIPVGPFSECDVCPSMIAIEPGEVDLGAADDDPLAQPHERPQRRMKFDRNFAVSRFEITREEFGAFVREAGYGPSRTCLVDGRRSSSSNWQWPGFEQTEKHPVVCISHADARAYVAWLTKRSGKSYRIISEAEWEYAARAGATTSYWTGERIGLGQANFDRSRDGTTPVGYYGPNGFGVHDVAGNAWDLTDDCYNKDLSFIPRDGRPTNLLGDCSLRVIRGGGWDSPAEHLRSSARGTIGEAGATNSTGLRVVREFK